MDMKGAVPEGGFVPSPDALENKADPGASCADLHEEEVLSQLERILESSLFTISKRHSQLLRFLVQHALRGDTAELDEYFLAERVFNRPPSFDASEDSIVRVEVGRLRRKLQLYFETLGSEDPLLIWLPPRSYIPAFRRMISPPVAPVVPVPESRRISLLLVGIAALLLVSGFAGFLFVPMLHPIQGKVPTKPAPSITSQASFAGQSPVLLVLPFSDISPTRSVESYGNLLTLKLIDDLEKAHIVSLVPRAVSLSLIGSRVSSATIGKQLNVRFVLRGTVKKNAQSILVNARLMSVAHGSDVWSAVFERNIKEFPILHRELSDETARAIQASLSEIHE